MSLLSFIAISLLACVHVAIGDEIPSVVGSAAISSLQDGGYDPFDEDDRIDVSHALVQLAHVTPNHERDLLFGNREAKPGGICLTSNACPEDFICTSGRCIPSPDSCLGQAIADHVAGFDSDAWIAEAMKEAGVTKESLMIAGRAFRNTQAIQASGPFQKLAAALEARPAPEIMQLKESVDSCMDEKQASCTIFYQGMNFEISGLADIAAAVLWAYGLNGAVGFVRGSFGLEIGIPGGDISYMFGFAFTCDPSDIATGGIVVDVDAGAGPNVGFATIAGFNGANAIEITFGAGFGLGIAGVGYSITAALNPTQSPTLSPTSAPTPTPPTGGGGGPSLSIADFGCGCTTDSQCATQPAGTTCSDGSTGEHDIFDGTSTTEDVMGTATCSATGDFYCNPSAKTAPNACGCQVDADCDSSSFATECIKFTSSPPCGQAVGQCSCFPGDALVEEESKGNVAMKDLATGDKILTSGGFSEIYGFGHGIFDKVGEFFQFSTGPFEPAIELTAFHQVFVGSSKTTKYAKDVQVGDTLIFKNTTLPVTGIEIVYKQGMYNPFTMDGTMFVNGFLASAFTQSSYMAVGPIELISKHHFKFMLHAPTRMLCTSAFAPHVALCSHDGDLRIGATHLVDYVMVKLIPGVMNENVNYLSLDSLLPIRLVLLLFWILPMYCLEQQGGLVALAGGALGGWLLCSNKKKNKHA